MIASLTTDILLAIVYPVIAFGAGWWLSSYLRKERPMTEVPNAPPTECPRCGSDQLTVDEAGQWWVCNICLAGADNCEWALLDEERTEP